MTNEPLDPRICNIAIDANTIDGDGTGLVDRFLKLMSAGTINVVLPKGVRGEILNPRTPSEVQDAALPQIFTLPVGLNPAEAHQKQIIAVVLQGNAKQGKHAADADHLFEAAKYCGYFVTNDIRILNRSAGLSEVLPPSLSVVTLADFLEIFDAWVARDAR